MLSPFRSIRFKISVSYVSIVAVLLILLNIYPVIVTQQTVFKAKNDSMHSQIALMSSTLSGLETLNTEDVERCISALDSGGLSRILVTDFSGQAVYDNSESNNSTGKYILLPELYYALTGSDVFYSEYKGGAFESAAAAPIMLRGNILGAVYIYEYDTEQAALLEGIRDTLSKISVVTCAIALIIGILVSGLLTRRIGLLLRTMKKMRAGQFEQRAQVGGNDELSELTDEFNSLADRLEKTEQVRRQFISDASHELKTPLASVRLLTDSILQTENMKPELLREFVGDIGEEIDRLTRMTEKLLALNRLDSKLLTEARAVDLYTVIERAARMLLPLAQSVQVTIRTETERNCLVSADEDDLYQAFFNLMENAIKYNRPGGEVVALLYPREKQIVAAIHDTGIGISQEHLTRIFERFYRVDKDRSRERGGSGLGLSIARENVEKNGGTIQVESETGKGTRFQITFPEFQKETDPGGEA